MHLASVHSSRYYSATPSEVGGRKMLTVASTPLFHTIVKRAEGSSEWVKIFVILGGIVGAAIVISLIIRCVRSASIKQAKKSGKFEQKQAQRWYGH